MWSLQREDTLSFDLTSKRMCLLFGAACPVAPWGSRASKLGWQGQWQLLLRDELGKEEGKHFWQKCIIPMLFLFPFTNACGSESSKSVLPYLFFNFRMLVIAHVTNYTLFLKMPRPFFLLSQRSTAVIAEFTALELLKTQIWCLMWLTPLSDTRSHQCPGVMRVQS